LGVASATNLTSQQLNVTGVGTFLSSGLKIRNPANTFGYTIAGDAIAADVTLTLPVVTSNTGIAVTGLAQAFYALQTFNQGITVINPVTFNNGTTNITAASQTTGLLTLGGPLQTGSIVLGQSTVSQTTNIQAGVSGVGTTKTINFGTGGASGSFTQINIGPTAGVGTVVINSGANLGVGTTNPTSKLHVVGDVQISGSGVALQQARLAILSKGTTDATPSTLTSNGNVYDGSNVLGVSTTSAYLVKGSVISYSNASDSARAWEFTTVIKRQSGSPSLVGTPIINDIAYDSGASGWNLSITADASTNSLKVEVIGQSSTTIRWVTKIDSTEVGF
jgi:hypothetical protein